MEDKRKDLKNTRQREVVSEVVAQLNQSHPDFYYLSTIEIASEIKKYIHQDGNLSRDKYLLMKDLSRHDIQMLLSLHAK